MCYTDGHFIPRLQREAIKLAVACSLSRCEYPVTNIVSFVCISQGELLPDIPLALPDTEGIFAPPGMLCVNDAAWLPSDGARLVHPVVPVHAAQALGAQSLRYHNQVCDCASALDLSARSQDGSCITVAA